MSVCRNCGAEIDWARKPDGGYIPVDPEPVFVIEGEGQDKFYVEEEGELIGREAAPGEVRTLEEKINTTLGFVPHWRTCPYRKRCISFRRKNGQDQTREEAETTDE